MSNVNLTQEKDKERLFTKISSCVEAQIREWTSSEQDMPVGSQAKMGQMSTNQFMLLC